MRWSEKPNERLVVAGKALEYSCFGPSPDKAATLVLLHEGLGCVALWRDFPEKLARATGLGVFVYSRSGYGQSDPALLPRPLHYMTKEAENILPELLDKIGFKSGFLLGHSDGATIAAIYCGVVPDTRLSGLILTAPHFFTEGVGLSAIAQTKENFDNGDLKSRLAKYHTDPENAFRGWNDSWLDPDFKNWNVADVLDNIRLPVLAVQGRDDQYGTLAQIEVIAQRVSGTVTTALIENCGHSPFSEKPSETLAAIVEFIALNEIN